VTKDRRRCEAGYSLVELLITLAVLAVITAIALPMYKEALLRAHISSGINDARAMLLAFKRYQVDHSAYPDDGAFDLATFEPLVSMGYYDGRVGTRILNDRADGYDAPDDMGTNQEFWLEFTLDYDPSVRFLVASSDDAPLGGGADYDGIFLFKGGVLDPL
jgi:prepilin-type N-terminal cleavage/methylation domain-containing protein